MTPRQQRIYSFIKSEIEAKGVSPSYHEMMAALGFRSRSEIHGAITALVEKGHLVRYKYRPRSLYLPGSNATLASHPAWDKLRGIIRERRATWREISDVFAELERARLSQ